MAEIGRTPAWHFHDLNSSHIAGSPMTLGTKVLEDFWVWSNLDIFQSPVLCILDTFPILISLLPGLSFRDACRKVEAATVCRNLSLTYTQLLSLFLFWMFFMVVRWDFFFPGHRKEEEKGRRVWCQRWRNEVCPRSHLPGAERVQGLWGEGIN